MSVLDRETVKAYLNVDDVTEDDEIQAFINQAEASLARRVGPLTPTEQTERHDPPWGNPIAVRVLPAISLTSVSPTVGAPLDVSTLELDPDTGIIRLKGTTDRYWAWYRTRFVGPYTVVYQAGWEELPADLQLAGMELVRHLWETQRRMVQMTIRGATAPGDVKPGGAFAYPYRVLELIAPYDQIAV